jgi:hypothetical protein
LSSWRLDCVLGVVIHGRRQDLAEVFIDVKVEDLDDHSNAGSDSATEGAKRLVEQP